jgi:hypothetical protein
MGKTVLPGNVFGIRNEASPGWTAMRKRSIPAVILISRERKNTGAKFTGRRTAGHVAQMADCTIPEV